MYNYNNYNNSNNNNNNNNDDDDEDEDDDDKNNKLIVGFGSGHFLRWIDLLVHCFQFKLEFKMPVFLDESRKTSIIITSCCLLENVLIIPKLFLKKIHHVSLFLSF